MVQGTIADQASEFAMPVSIEVKGRKVLVRGADGVWTDSVQNVHIEASTPTVFRIHFEGTDWTFRPDNPLDAHFDLLDPWTQARSSRRGRIHIRKAEPDAWNPVPEVAVARAQAGGVEIESIATPTSIHAYERLPLVSEVASETVDSPVLTASSTSADGSSLVASDAPTPDTAGPAGFHFVEAVQPGAAATTTSNDPELIDFDVLPPRDASLETMSAGRESQLVEDEVGAPVDNKVATDESSDVDQPTDVIVAPRESEQDAPETHVFIDIDALPKPEARDPFGGDDLPTPQHRTLEETLRQDAWRPAEPPAQAGGSPDSTALARLHRIAIGILGGVGFATRTGLALLGRFMVWLWTVLRPALISFTRRLGSATAPMAKQARSLILGMPPGPAAIPGEVAEGEGPEMCADVHAWSISAHGPFRVARCIYCEEVRMDSEPSQTGATPAMRRFEGLAGTETDRPLSMLGDR